MENLNNNPPWWEILSLSIRNGFFCVFKGALIFKMLLVKRPGRGKHLNTCLYLIYVRGGKFTF